MPPFTRPVPNDALAMLLLDVVELIALAVFLLGLAALATGAGA